MANCTSIQKSLAWCQGTPELPGVKRRIYYIAKTDIAMFPTLPHDALGRTTSAVLQGDFVLKSDRKWKYIDILPDKSQLTSEAQGELPSQTQLNKLTAVHPGVGEEASAAAAYINNTDSVFIVEDMKGNFRVLGNDKWSTKATVTQDLGQGATGTTSTTISVEATDEVPAPFYKGEIASEDVDMVLDDSQSTAQLFTYTTSDYAGMTDADANFGMSGSDFYNTTINVQDVSIFSYGKIVKFEGVSGYNEDGTTSDEDFKALIENVRLEHKIIRIISINGQPLDGYRIVPPIPENTKIVIVS